MARTSVMKHQFSQVPRAEIPRSSFNRSHGLKTACNAGDLVPIFVDEVLPGDTLSLRATLFGRMATPIKPILDNIFCETFFFFVPNRLTWKNWQKFNGEQENPGDSTDFTIPQFNGSVVVDEGSLPDYFGIPLGVDPSVTRFSALPFRGYNLIWREWFRSQDLQDSPYFTTEDNDVGNWQDNYPIRKRGKRHDYFTSCLPFAQKGDPVMVPLGDTAPVAHDASSTGDDITVFSSANAGYVAMDASQATLKYSSFPGTEATSLYADLSQAAGITINDLRQSFQIQRLLERDARGGTRYTEIIRSHFGVISPDARLQRPEFLGGGSTMVTIHPVQQQAATSSDVQTMDTPQGNLAAFGTVSARNHGFTKSFTEHGYVIGLVNFRADLTYQQGLARFWSRQTRFDFFWPALSHLGEMAVLNKEIFVSNDPVVDEAVFGYQEAWADYRYKPSLITSTMRSTATAPIDVWHLSQEFATLPVLDDAFIQDNPPIDRVIAVPTEAHFLLDVYFNYRCARPMPLYGVPGLIDHF